MVLLGLIPALPLISSIILALGKKLPGKSSGIIASLSISLSAVLSIIVFFIFKTNNTAITFTIFQWFNLSSSSSAISLNLDALSSVMILVVTVVGSLIHFFSIEHMEGEEGYHRFFANMNLFVFFMLILVLADNYVLMYLGWEGVGLCSFMLIGFWYRDRQNGLAAKKAFFVTRIGDVAFLLGIILIAQHLGSLNIQEASQKASSLWQENSNIAFWAGLLLLCGALGKSAQLPLHTWLPDAMAGPSPVSALIHAATMVTAGVYLIARSNAIFILSPSIMFLVATIGALTLLIAGITAIFQYDFKKILAYSTMSQIGYMFLALGASLWSGAVFHLAMHALFKALLFLTAGAIINSLYHERNIINMGGIAKIKKLFFWLFLIGAFGLTALPPVSSGFASKDGIIQALWNSPIYLNKIFWLVSIIGALLTSIYTFRLLYLVFSGASRLNENSKHDHGSQHLTAEGLATTLPLIILAFFSLVAGILDFPKIFGGKAFFGDFLSSVFPTIHEHEIERGLEILLALVPFAVTLIGIFIGKTIATYNLRTYKQKISDYKSYDADSLTKYKGILGFFQRSFDFDRLYSFLIVRPITYLAERRIDPINSLIEALRKGLGNLSIALEKKQDGRPRPYLLIFALGTVILITMVIIWS